MDKRFCKWCNRESIDEYPCYLCGALYCEERESPLVDTFLEGNLYLPKDFSMEDLIDFTEALSYNLPDKEHPYDPSYSYGTFKHFYEKVYSKVDSKIFSPLHVCKYCTSKQLQRIEEELFPVFRSVKDSGLICSHYICPIDAEKKCDNCNKFFCRMHSAECSKCHKTYCTSESCVSAHIHKRRWLFW